MTSYSFRRSALEKEKTFSLDENGLKLVDSNGLSIEIPYENISAIRLSFMPDRMRTNNYQCNIESSKGNFNYLSSSYVSFANFRSDHAAYKAFTLELIDKTSRANPTVALLSGKPKTTYMLSIIVMIICFVAVALLIYYLGDYMSSISWVKFVLILLLIPMAFSYVMKNKPGVFTADNIPPKLLPA